MADVRAAVVGVGSLGFHHARLLRDLPGVKLAGIHDSDPARLAAVATDLGVTPWQRLSELLEAIDVAVIAVPTSSHELVAIEALRRGVHLLIEKPIAPTLAAADRILDAAGAAGALIQVGHVERFNAAVRACEPYLGDPLFVESHRLAPFDPRGTDVAVVLDLMIHDLDLLLSLVPDPVVSIAAVGVPVLAGSPDIANARLEFEGGCVANLTASRVSLERRRKFRFFQRSGYISLDLASGEGEFLRVKEGLAVAPGTPLAGRRLEDVVERIVFRGDGSEPLRVELESFVAAVRGHRPIAVPGEHGRRALQVALEIMRSIEEHVTVSHPA